MDEDVFRCVMSVRMFRRIDPKVVGINWVGSIGTPWINSGRGSVGRGVQRRFGGGEATSH